MWPIYLPRQAVPCEEGKSPVVHSIEVSLKESSKSRWNKLIPPLHSYRLCLQRMSSVV